MVVENWLPKGIKWYYSDKWVAIAHGDCREILPQLDVKVDLVLTDPPYGVNKAEWDSAFDISALELCHTQVIGLMPGVWNITHCPSRIAGLNYKWTIIAHLINGMARSSIGFGNYIPCLVYTNDKTVYDKTTDCMDVIVGTPADKPDHPSPKPEKAMAWFVSRLSGTGQLILDPFLGSGTTCYCAKKLNRYSIGIEIEEKYCEIAAKRCCQEVMEFGQ